MAPRSTLDQDRYLDVNGELITSLEDLENVENENRDIRENVQLANECTRKLREN